MTAQQIIALVIFLFPLAYSPGPGNMFFAANGAMHGVGSTATALAGYHLATWLITVGIGLGFSSILDNHPTAFLVVKVAGALYVLWLAGKFLRAGILAAQPTPRRASFIDGVVLLLLNPKAYFIIAVMFSQFLDTSQNSIVRQVIWISTLFTLNNLIAFTLWAAVGDWLAGQFRRSSSAKTLNAVFGGLLAAVGVWMLVN